MDKEKEILISKLKDNKVFWSYKQPDYNSLSDNVIICNVILYLDSDEIDMLFNLYSREFIKKVWIDEILSLDRYYSLNRFIALIYFGIDNPDEYIKKHRKH